MQGAVLQMVNHGISTGALFLLVGVIYDRRHTRKVDEFGGLAKVMPIYATLFLIVTFASVGVPGTNGFIGEFMVISGTFVSERLGTFSGVHAVGAAFGVILAAVYMLSVVQKMFFGPLSNPKNKHLPDLTVRESLALAPLVVMIFVIGFFPNIFLDRMKAAIELHHNQFKFVSGQAVLFSDDRDAKILPADAFNPLFLKGAPGAKADEEKAEPTAAAAPDRATAPDRAAPPGGAPPGRPVFPQPGGPGQAAPGGLPAAPAGAAPGGRVLPRSPIAPGGRVVVPPGRPPAPPAGSPPPGGAP
jgi:NADH-quinone oxidoreductase subunit M